MLMRCARAYSSSWLQVSWSISIHMVAINLMQPKVDKKRSPKPIFWGSRSIKVMDVDTIKKHVTSAYYDKQHVCAYL